MTTLVNLCLYSSPLCPTEKRTRSARCYSNQIISKSSQDPCYNTSQPILTPRKNKRRCVAFNLHNQLVPYDEAWSWQKSIVEERKALVELNEDCSDTLIVLQHNPVYTLGTGSSEEYLNFDMKDAPYSVYRTERGGEVTYHGPGQLVMYPIINLRYHNTDLHWYTSALEEVVIRVLSSTFSINACRVKGLTGVWVGDQKVAAIGIRVSKWVTYHGLALNVTTDLAPFERIVPCGIKDRRVGSIKQLLREQELTSSGACSCFDDSKLIDITYKSLLNQFSQVFQVELHHHHKDFSPVNDHGLSSALSGSQV